MTTPRRPLSPAQIRQRQEASLAAKRRREEEGLTEAEIAQRQEASRRAALTPKQREAEKRKDERKREAEQRRRDAAALRWQAGEEKRKRENERLKADASRKISFARDQGIAPQPPERLARANINRLVAMGFDSRDLEEAGLETAHWNQAIIQRLVKKYGALRSKGFSKAETVARLKRRGEVSLKKDGRGFEGWIIGILREYYSPEKRSGKRHRRPLTPRQQEMKRRRDAGYRREHREEIRRRDRERRERAA